MISRTLVILEHKDGKVEIHEEIYEGDLNSFRDRVKVTLEGEALKSFESLGIENYISFAKGIIEELLSRQSMDGVRYHHM